MGDLGALLKNPYVLGGGVLLIVLGVLASKSGGSSSASAGPSLGTIQSYNNLAISQGAQSAQIATAQIGANTQQVLGVLSLLGNMDASAAGIQKQQIVSQAGVANAIVQGNTAVTVDALNNAARTQQTWLTTEAAKVISNDQVRIAKAQAEAATNNSIFGAIGNIGKAAVMYGA
jgi:hypothetical protein